MGKLLDRFVPFTPTRPTQDEHRARVLQVREAQARHQEPKPLPPLPAKNVTRLRDRSDRELAHDLACQLRMIAAAAAQGWLPRWLLISLATSTAMMAHVVRDFLHRNDTRHACGPGCGLTP